MTPAYNVIAAGISITSLIRDRLISLTVSDEAGSKSDAVEIVLDNRDGKVERPMRGAPLVVSMGYAETFLMPMGLYTSDEIVLSGWPQTITLRGKAAALGGPIKEPKSRSWDDKTLGDIVRTIAGEQGLTPKIAAPLDKVKYPHLDQTDESDIHFLNRIARDHDAMATVKGGALIVMPKARGLTVSGLAMLPRPIASSAVTTYNMTEPNQVNWKSVSATWHDLKAGKRETITAGSGAPTRKLRHIFPTKDEAETAAKAALTEAQRGDKSLSLTLIGDPTIAAGGRILVTGICLGVDGLWSVKSANHTISSAGFETTIEAETASL